MTSPDMFPTPKEITLMSMSTVTPYIGAWNAGETPNDDTVYMAVSGAFIASHTLDVADMMDQGSTDEASTVILVGTREQFRQFFRAGNDVITENEQARSSDNGVGRTMAHKLAQQGGYGLERSRGLA